MQNGPWRRRTFFWKQIRSSCVATADFDEVKDLPRNGAIFDHQYPKRGLCICSGLWWLYGKEDEQNMKSFQAVHAWVSVAHPASNDSCNSWFSQITGGSHISSRMCNLRYWSLASKWDEPRICAVLSYIGWKWNARPVNVVACTFLVLCHVCLPIWITVVPFLYLPEEFYCLVLNVTVMPSKCSLYICRSFRLGKLGRDVRFYFDVRSLSLCHDAF